MRGTNGPMDVITRAEFDDSMKDVLTKTDFEQRLAETKSELISAMKLAVRENINDLKVDLFAEIEQKVRRSHSLLELGAVKSSDLKDAKNEILATMRRNIEDAVAPLKADLNLVKSDVAGLGSDVAGLRSEVAGLRSEVDLGFLKMGARIDEMRGEIKMVADGHVALDEKLTRLGSDIRETLKQHEHRLDRHDADLYKLRQSGVLN
jgi:multidrug resistance efflux pump